jgi:hypothetical protein
MQVNLKSYVTAGVAVVGAGAIAMTPIAPPPDTFESASRTHEVNLLASTQVTAANQALATQLALLQSGDPVSVLRAFIEGTLAQYAAPGNRRYAPATEPIDGSVHIGEGVAASGLRFGDALIRTPLRFAGLVPAFAEGNGQQAFADLIVNLVDGPLWVVDPVLYSLRDALPAPLGGPGGFVETFRNQIWSGTEEVNSILADPAAALQSFIDGTLYQYGAPGPRPYAPQFGPIGDLGHIAEGAIATGLRLAAAAVLTPLSFIQLAGAVVEGKGPETIAGLIANIVDGPLWAADPALYFLRDALPAPLGGPGELVENFRNGIWSGTEQINAAVRSILGLPATPSAGAGLRTADDSSSNKRSESYITSIPDTQAQLVKQQDDQPQEKLQQDPPAGGAGVANEAGAPTGNADPVIRTNPPAPPAAKPVLITEKLKKLERNLVRGSLNFSTRGKATGTQGATGDGVDVITTDTPPQVDAPQAAPDKPADAGTGESGSGSPAGDAPE